MNNGTYVLTSESVSEGHPDKVADQISDAILDLYLTKDPQSKVAVETLITDNKVILAGETKSKVKINNDAIRQTVIDVLTDIGYDNDSVGFNCNDFKLSNYIHEQSQNINDGVKDGGAGDQGIMFGYASDETPEYMPLPIMLAHKLVKQQSVVRKNGTIECFGPDAKSQVSLKYVNGKPESITQIVFSTQHAVGVHNMEIEFDTMRHIINPCIPEQLINNETKILINPSGKFEIGGPKADTGLTGRKIIVDTYGGVCPHGGGAFSGKDASKVDRSAAYMARYIAKNFVASNTAKKCTIQLSYAIGEKHPLSIYVDFHGTGKISESEAVIYIEEHYDLTPNSIIKKLDLLKPIYRNTAAYGHFGRTDVVFPWEDVSSYTNKK